MLYYATPHRAPPWYIKVQRTQRDKDAAQSHSRHAIHAHIAYTIALRVPRDRSINHPPQLRPCCMPHHSLRCGFRPFPRGSRNVECTIPHAIGVPSSHASRSTPAPRMPSSFSTLPRSAFALAPVGTPRLRTPFQVQRYRRREAPDGHGAGKQRSPRCGQGWLGQHHCNPPFPELAKICPHHWPTAQPNSNCSRFYLQAETAQITSVSILVSFSASQPRCLAFPSRGGEFHGQKHHSTSPSEPSILPRYNAAHPRSAIRRTPPGGGRFQVRRRGRRRG